LVLKGLEHCRAQAETKECINRDSISEILNEEDDNDDFEDPQHDNDDEQS
jgi:hypothetical protein